MAKIYQLMIDNEQVNDLYYDEDDAIENATQIAKDSRKSVGIWEAEEIEGIPYDALEWTMNIHVLYGEKIPEEQKHKVIKTMANNQNGEHGVITNFVGASYFDGGYESFDYAVKAMMADWELLSVQQQISFKNRDYCDENGSDYMIAVGFYNEETGEAWESMTLAEAIEAREEEEEKESKMATIYRLRIGKRMTNVVYYQEYDAMIDAADVYIETGKRVGIWEAEEREDIPLDLLEWTLSREVF